MAGKNKKGLIERPRTTCAQGGALATIGSLPDVVAISHAAEGCGGNLSGAISLNSGNNGEGFCSGNQIPTSAIREKNVIFGGRLGAYQYYDMDKVVRTALDLAAKEL